MENYAFKKICRFCLQTSDSNFEIIEEVTLANLDLLWLKLNISISDEPAMCGDCAKAIRTSSDFKTRCLETENCIVSCVKENNSIKVDLREVYVRKMSGENIVKMPEDHIVCRLCLELVRNNSVIFLRNSADIVLKLEQYLPELDLTCTEDSVVCASCQVSLQCYFNFINNCLTTEEKVMEYCKVEGTNGMGQIDLNSIIRFISKDFLKSKFEEDIVKIEETYNEVSENTSNNVEVKEEILDMELDIKEDSFALESELADENSFQHHPSPSQSDYVPQLTRAKPAEYTCEICGYHNDHESRLQPRIPAHKGIVQEYNCEICPFKTKTKGILKKHMVRHKDACDVTMYKCDKCTYETKHKYHLQQHMQIHMDKSEIKMHECELCPFKTKWKSSLRTHLRIHRNTAGTMYKCDLCDYATEQKSDLKSHLLTHKTHSETPLYKCDLCDHETKRRSDLKRHMLTHKTHLEITMYKCYHCDYETKWKFDLDGHLLTHNLTQIQM